MKSKKISFLENKKLQLVIVFAVSAALIFGGSKIESRNLTSDISLTTGAIATIQIEVNKVKTARNEYFTAIGKSDGGAYDEYQNASNCLTSLDTRLVALKNLRNDFQRLSGEIVMRERENESELPRGTIERELRVIEKEIRPALILNQVESIETELQKIEKTATTLENDSSEIILTSIEKIREEIEAVATTSVIEKELDVIEKELSQFPKSTNEIIEMSITNIREIIETNDDSSTIRQITQNISRLAENGDNTELIEADLKKIEARTSSFSRSQQLTIQESIDSIRKLLSRKSLAEIRTEKIASIESEMRTITNKIFSTTELEQRKAEELKVRISFQETTSALENCMTTKQDVEKCENELRDWVASKESYQSFILTFQNILAAKKIEIETKLTPLQKELDELQAEKDEQNFSPILSAFLQQIDAEHLRADMAGFDFDLDEGPVTGDGSGMDDGGADALNDTYDDSSSGWGDVLSGASGYLSAGVNGVSAALGFSAGGLTSTAIIFDGPGALTGLRTFRQNYKGNSYGSAIGIITGWTNFVLPFVGVIAIAALVYAGFLYITAAGNEEQTKKAKNIIMWVVIGIIIIFSAYAIVNTLLSSNSSSGGGGTNIDIDIGGLGLNYSD